MPCRILSVGTVHERCRQHPTCVVGGSNPPVPIAISTAQKGQAHDTPGLPDLLASLVPQLELESEYALRAIGNVLPQRCWKLTPYCNAGPPARKPRKSSKRRCCPHRR
uniref:Uncharacterized protein n=1 Tax=Strombidinopsis acuminata TaxID=141414 RepID=A0A7S3RSL7_9SPIT